MECEGVLRMRTTPGELIGFAEGGTVGYPTQES